MQSSRDDELPFWLSTIHAAVDDDGNIMLLMGVERGEGGGGGGGISW